MVTISILLLIWAGIANAVMDGIQFRWRGSYWERRSRRNDWLGRWLAGWWSVDAWKNKHKYRGVMKLIMSTWLVMLTDAWHFFQWLMFTCMEINIAMWMGYEVTGVMWQDMFIVVMAMKSIRGMTFELIFSFSKYVFVMRKLIEAIRTLFYAQGKTMSRLTIVVAFLASAAVAFYKQPVSDFRAFVAVGIIVTGMILAVVISRYASRPYKRPQQEDG